MKKKIICFLVKYKFTEIDFFNLNLSNLCKCFSVKFIDLSEISSKKKNYSLYSKIKKKNIFYKKIKNINELKKILLNVKYVFDYGQLLLENKLINSYFSKKVFKKKIYGLISGALPNFVEHSFKQKFFFIILYLFYIIKYKKFFIIMISLKKFIKIYFFLIKKKYKSFNYYYDYVLVDSDINEKKANIYFPNSKKIFIHYKDYEKHLLRSNKKKYQGNYAVFLDEAVFDHPDIYESWSTFNSNLSSYANNYFNNLNKFFDNFERCTGMKVIIAAHPKSLYSDRDYDNYFQNRKVIKYNTYELVRGSKLVFAHASTSVAYAIIMKKPLVFLNSSDMFDIGYFTRILSFAIETGCKLVDINAHINHKELLKKRISLYKNYFCKFLKSSK